MKDIRATQHNVTVSKSGILSGNNLALYFILMGTQTRILKVEGRHIEWGKQSQYYELIVIRNGQLDYHISYMELEMEDYNAVEENTLLRFDNVDVPAVVKLFVNERGLYISQTGEEEQV